MKVVGKNIYPNRQEATAIIQYLTFIIDETKRQGYTDVLLEDLEKHRSIITNML
ncbi:hypothetical protein PBI_PEREGRIN_193 [Rhodococcus phage Peregrin]|nr:hypothetical protein PBI_PEREGRIN_193 [Rhodococcus phage Peregrin]